MICLNDRFKVGTTVHLILIKDNLILLQRRFNTSYEDGNYSVVAGHINGGETIREAMVREALEEAKLNIVIDDLRVIHVMHRKSPLETVDFFLTTDKWSGEAIIGEPDKADDLRWFNLDNLPENMVAYVKAALSNINKKIFYSEFGFDGN